MKGDVNKVKNELLEMEEEKRKQCVRNFKNGNKVEVLGYSLEPNLFDLKIVAKEGFAVATLNNNLVALDIQLTDELVEEGILREIIRQIQVARKDANFEISDRIVLFVESADEKTQKVVEKNKNLIMNETLAVKFENNNPEYETTKEISNSTITIKMKR